MSNSFETFRNQIGEPTLNQRKVRFIQEGYRRVEPLNRKVNRAETRRNCREQEMVSSGETVLVREGDELYRQLRVPDPSALQVELIAGASIVLTDSLHVGGETPLYLGVSLPRIDGPVGAEPATNGNSG